MATDSTKTTGIPPDNPTKVRGPVAVIDIGTTSIRMVIAQIDSSGDIQTLEKLSQAVNLGKDTFTKGSIEHVTIEQCVRVLKSYRERLNEYQITDPQQIHVVATSAVREAANRLTFLNRIYVATGFVVDPIEDAEVNRITYLGIQPILRAEPALAAARTLVIEVGGGSTEILVVQGGDVIHSHTVRFGSLRIRKTLEAYREAGTKIRHIVEGQIGRIVEPIRPYVPDDRSLKLIALGGDVRFAATQLLTDWNTSTLGQVSVDELQRLTDQVLDLSIDELVAKYRLTFPEAETLGPALLTYLRLARAFQLEQILVSSVDLRFGLLKEMVVQEAWSEGFRNQIIRSALDLGRRFNFAEAHGLHVAGLSEQLFDQLQSEHQLAPRYKLILYLAGLLHDIGHVLNSTSHHKHSMYLIANGELFGLSKKDVLLVALVARYHRRASPKPLHEGYDTLDWESRIAVAKMAAMLRVADSLDRSGSQRIKEIDCRRENGRLVIHVPSVDDVSLEQLAFNQKSSLFEEVFGMQVLLRTT